MQRIYLDNAATTPLSEDVLNDMLPYFKEKFGNASSIYSFGRESRLAIEKSRKTIAQWMYCKPGEIFFTSCGTESSNTAIQGAVYDLGCTRIISSSIEHHATLHTVQFLEKRGHVELCNVNLKTDGEVDLEHLAFLLSSSDKKTLVSLMHANNEVGNLLDLKKVSELCEKHQAIFHTDAVQTVAHYPIHLDELYIHFLSASGHKFHGPKGNGFLYIQSGITIHPYIHGGSQERNMRAGTENVAGIVGLASALDRAMVHLEEDRAYISTLKSYFKDRILQMPGVCLNGLSDEQSLFTVLNIAFPKNEKTEALSMNLDIHGICVSGGSACSSGAEGGSHVIRGIYPERTCVPIRFSFSKYNTKEELNIVLEKISNLIC